MRRMLDELLKRKRMLVILAVVSLLVSCGISSYDTPTTTATPAVISADTVNLYVASGSVNGAG